MLVVILLLFLLVCLFLKVKKDKLIEKTRKREHNPHYGGYFFTEGPKKGQRIDEGVVEVADANSEYATTKANVEEEANKRVVESVVEANHGNASNDKATNASEKTSEKSGTGITKNENADKETNKDSENYYASLEIADQDTNKDNGNYYASL